MGWISWDGYRGMDITRAKLEKNSGLFRNALGRAEGKKKCSLRCPPITLAKIEEKRKTHPPMVTTFFHRTFFLLIMVHSHLMMKSA